MNSLKILRLAFSAGIVLILTSCSSMVTTTQFKPYIGVGVFQGSGGTKRTVKGIDVWENGEPNCKFKVLGYVDDDVLENQGAAPSTLNLRNVATVIALEGREKRFIDIAKQCGADAIVYIAANRTFQYATQYETNFRNQVKIAVVKYIAEAGYGLGDKRQMIETYLGHGTWVPFDKLGIKLAPEEQADFTAVTYPRDKGMLIIVYNKGLADLIMMGTEGGLTEQAIVGLLTSFGKGQEWKKSVPPTNPKFPFEWVRSDGLYYAVCAPEAGLFIVGNKQTLHLK